jgi:hypothetical protein
MKAGQAANPPDPAPHLTAAGRPPRRRLACRRRSEPPPVAARRPPGRKPLLAGVAFFLVLVGLVVPLARPRRCPVTPGAFGCIQRGMSQAEVEHVLGGPPGDSRTRPIQVGLTHWDFRREGRLEVWYGDEGAVLVYFHSTGAVAQAKEFKPAAAARLFETLRWRLNW